MKNIDKTIRAITGILICCAILLTSFSVGAGAVTNNNTNKEVDIFDDEIEVTTQPTTAPTSDTNTEATQTPETSATTTTEATEPTTNTEPTEVTEPPVTTIVLAESKHTIFINKTYTIKPHVKNGDGLVKYTSEDENIATVNDKGVVTAHALGKVKIYVENNGAQAVFTLKVKKPYLAKHGNEVKTITVKRNCNVPVRIKGKIKGEDNDCRYSGSVTVFDDDNDDIIYIKGNKITGKHYAVVKVNVSGYTLRLNIKVVAKTDYQKYVKVRYTHTKPNISRIFNDTIHVNGLYEVKTNLNKLVKNGKLTEAQKNSYLKVVKPKAYSVNNSKVLKINKKNGTVKAVGKGTAVVAFRFKDGTKLRTTVKVTKPLFKTVYEAKTDDHGDSYLTNNKVKAKVCYTKKELYDAVVDAVCNHILKGEKPEYMHLYIGYDIKNVEDARDDIWDCAYKYYDDGNNLAEFLRAFAVQFGADITCYPENKTMFVGPLSNCKEDIELFEKRLKTCKEIYTAAMKIFDKAKVGDKYNVYDNDLDTLISLTNYLDSTVSTNYKENNYSEEYRGVILRGGGCQAYTRSFIYLCTLLHIPCYDVSGIRFRSHAWTVLKIGDKFYFYEPQNAIYETFGAQGFGNQMLYALWGMKDWNPRYTYDDRNKGGIVDNYIYNKSAAADYGITFTYEQVMDVLNKSGQELSGFDYWHY